MKNRLLKLVEDSQRIMVTSHISPDPDAVCSSLLFARTLDINYPDKQVLINLEELSDGLEFLPSYDKVQAKPLGEALLAFMPDLLVILDANSFGRCSRDDGEEAKIYINERAGQTKVVIIDHHEPKRHDQVDLFIHEDSPATTQIVYSLLFEKVGLKKPEELAETTLLGIVSDTSRFLHENPAHRETFRVVSDLLDAGASIERLTNRLSRYSLLQMKVFGELANNIVMENDYVYAFISEKFKNDWLRGENSFQELKTGAEIFVSGYLRNIDDKQWGFIAYPELFGKSDVYGVSLRAQSGVRDVSAIARKLGGGGHKPAAGAKVKARNVEEAIELAKEAIAETSASS